jgi:hypothetical protein
MVDQYLHVCSERILHQKSFGMRDFCLPYGESILLRMLHANNRISPVGFHPVLFQNRKAPKQFDDQTLFFPVATPIRNNPAAISENGYPKYHE